MNKNCLLCGVGGQGVVLASRLIAFAAMEKGNFVRTEEMLSFLNEKAGCLIVIDGGELCRRAGSPKVLNTVLLGAASECGALGITTEEMKEAVRANVKERFVSLNEKALDLGSGAVKESSEDRDYKAGGEQP